MRDNGSADMLNYDGGMEWNRMEWNGMESNGMESNGMESNVIIIFVYNNYVRLLYCI